MSTWSMVEVGCPACSARVELPIARGVHASRAPRWREAVLDGSLHRARCGGCGVELDVRSAFVYTDLGRGQWVHVETPAALPRWRALEAEALAGFDRWGGTSPLFAETARGLRMRIVFGVDELRERLLIWDAGLDDAAVECAKLAALRERADLRRSGERLRVEFIDDLAPGAPDSFVAGPAPARSGEGDLHLRAVSAAEPRRARAAWTTPRATIDQLDLAAWRRQFPELFGRGFVSIDRWLADEEPRS